MNVRAQQHSAGREPSCCTRSCFRDACLLLAALAAALQSCDAFSDAALYDKSKLLDCYKNADASALTFREYMAGQPSRLHLHAVLGDTPAALDSQQKPVVLTVVTALNMARLDSLVAQCQSWPGPLVAALYVPLQQGGSSGELSKEERRLLQQAQQQAQDTVKPAQSQAGSCQMRVLVLYERVASPFLAALIPINALRNAALLAASTPLVAMVDVDLLVSACLGRELVAGSKELVGARTQQLLLKCQKERAAVILPAFQTPKNQTSNAYPLGQELERSIKLVQNLVQGDKSAIQKAVQRGDIIKFASQQFAVGHRRTNYARWFESSSAYQVDFVPQFEPWYVVDRLHTPFYDANFRGYGRNKQQQAAHAHSVGMPFWVHPDAFLLHMPHDRSEAQKDHDATWSTVRERRMKGGPMRGGAAAGGRAAGGAGQGRGRRRQQQQQQHQQSAGRGLLQEAAAGDQQQQQMPEGLQHVRRVDKLFRQFVQQMNKRDYRTLLDPAALTCLEKLPWWSGSSVLGWSTSEPNQ